MPAADTTATPLGVTFGSLGVLGPRAVVDVAQMASAQGYRSLWTVEATGTDAFTLLGAASAVAPDLDLATGIIPVQIRNPTVTAMTASTLQALSPDATVWAGSGRLRTRDLAPARRGPDGPTDRHDA